MADQPAGPPLALLPISSREEPSAGALNVPGRNQDRNQFQTRCGLSWYCNVMKKLQFTRVHRRLMMETPFQAYYCCEPVNYPLSLIVDLVARYEGNNCFKIGPCSLTFGPSELGEVMGLPNKGKSIDLKKDGEKATLRTILGPKASMDRHHVLQKLTEYLPRSTEAAVDISVRLWIALLCSCFFFPTTGRAGTSSVLPPLDDLNDVGSFNWATAIHEYLMGDVEQIHEQVKAAREGKPCPKNISMKGCIPALGVSLQ